jgi:6-phosphogluconate dehydrogenase
MNKKAKSSTERRAWNALVDHHHKVRDLHLQKLFAEYDFNLADISEVWRRGSVIASWLLDLTADALAADAQLAKFGGRVSDSGEGRWTIKAAIDEGVPVPVLTTALYERFSSRGEADYADRLLSAMRFGFGGHLEKSTK